MNLFTSICIFIFGKLIVGCLAHRLNIEEESLIRDDSDGAMFPGAPPRAGAPLIRQPLVAPRPGRAGASALGRTGPVTSASTARTAVGKNRSSWGRLADALGFRRNQKRALTEREINVLENAFVPAKWLENPTQLINETIQSINDHLEDLAVNEQWVKGKVLKFEVLQIEEPRLQVWSVPGEAKWIDVDKVNVKVRAHLDKQLDEHFNAIERLGGPRWAPDEDPRIDITITGGFRVGWTLFRKQEDGWYDWRPHCVLTNKMPQDLPSTDVKNLKLKELGLKVAYNYNVGSFWDASLKKIAAIAGRAGLFDKTIENKLMEMLADAQLDHWVEFQGVDDPHSIGRLVTGAAPPISEIRYPDWLLFGDTDTQNFNEECWPQGCRGGPCAFCGLGLCCRRGFYLGGCDGSGDDEFRCVDQPRLNAEGF